MAESKIQTSTQFNILSNPNTEAFHTVSGSDIIGIVGHVEFTGLQAVSVSVNREIHPIYVMGRTDPIAFVRNKRGVAGSLVAICADRGALYDINEKYGVAALPKGDTHIPGRNTIDFTSGGRYNSGNSRSFENGVYQSPLAAPAQLGYDLITPQYYDELPPFDLTLVGRSDALTATVSRVGGVFIVSMGTGMSVDDASIEQQMTFVALYYEDWRPAGRRNMSNMASMQADGTLGKEINPFAEQGLAAEQVDTSRLPTDRLGQQFGLGIPRI